MHRQDFMQRSFSAPNVTQRGKSDIVPLEIVQDPTNKAALTASLLQNQRVWRWHITCTSSNTNEAIHAGEDGNVSKL
jgi:hypothetical protein